MPVPEGVRDELPHVTQLPAHGALRRLLLLLLLLLRRWVLLPLVVLGGALGVLRCARCAEPRAQHAAALVGAAGRPPGRQVGAPAHPHMARHLLTYHDPPCLVHEHQKTRNEVRRNH